MQITYKDKVTLQSNPNIPDENKVTAKDMNEIKSVINFNEEEQQALNMSVQEIAQNVVNNSQEISNIKEEQTTQNDNIQTNSNNISDLQSNKADKNEIPTDLSQLSNENTKFVNETGLENAISQEKTQRQNADNNLQNQIDAITASTDVIDIVGTYQDLQDYDTSKVKQNDVIKVLKDSTHNNAMSYYRWQNQWIYIGIEGPYYTIGQTDELLQGKANQSDLKQTNTNVTNLAGRVSNNERKIENIEQEQTEQNTNISTNATNIESLQEENENLKKIVSQLPQVEGQGTSITLENTIEAQFTKFDVEGNSDQETTEGRNMLDINKVSVVLRETLNNGVITSDTSTEATTMNVVPYFPNIAVNEGDTIYFNCQVKLNSGSTGVFGNLNDGVNGGTKAILVPTLSTTYQKYQTSFTYTSNTNINKLLIQIKNLVGSVEIKDMMISKSSSNEFEKFTYGASPNPNYEQPIESAGDNENLLNPELAEDKKYQNIDGNYSISTHSIAWISGLQSIESSKNYVLNYQAQTGAFYDENRNVITTTSIYKKTTFQTPSNAKYVNLTFLPEVIAFADKNKIKLEKGNKASGYSPYGMGSINEKIKNADGTEEQDYSIFVQQPFRSNKDKTIKDKFVIKSDNKKYERHWIGEVVLNGTEEVYLYNDNGSRAVFYINVADLYDYTNSAETPELLSNRFRPVSQTATWEPGGIACRIGGRAIFFIFKTGTSVNEFKNWLSTHNVVVQYLLAEPLDLPCTETQIQQLENKPSTYKDFTIINSEDETKAYLEVSGIYDMNKLITRVEVIESEV